MSLADARTRAAALDADDPVAFARDRFVLRDGLVYLDGNSLGAMPVGVLPVVEEVLNVQWGRDLITSWNDHDWWDAPRRIGRVLARLVGAEPDEVLAADSTSVNLFKVLVAAARLRPDRKVLVIEPGNFPADLYIADSVGELLGLQVRRVDPLELEGQIDDSVGVVAYSQVDYRTGRAYDMAAITETVHRHGALAVWDLSHSAGVLPVDLGGADVDFAVGCGYKYLNGGPGAPAFLMVAQRHQDSARQPLAGWTGHARPFAMEDRYDPGRGIDRFRCGTPPLLSMLTLEAALTAYDGLDLMALRAKSLSLTDLFIELCDEQLAPLGFEVVTPRAQAERGSQVSLSHREAYGVVQALIGRDVVGDFRAPDLVRLGFSPLYLRHVDVVDAVERIVEVVRLREHLDGRYAVRATVT